MSDDPDNDDIPGGGICSPPSAQCLRSKPVGAYGDEKMTLDLHIGHMTTTRADDDPDGETFPYVKWTGPLPENDGTDPECTCCHGDPVRMISWLNTQDIFEKIPVLHELLDGWSGTNDWQVFPISDTLAQAVENSPDPVDRINHDRWVWLRYWVRRAREEYGDEAGLLVT